MARTHARYAPEYRQQMVEFARADRSVGELAAEFDCSAQTIGNGVHQAERTAGGCRASRKRVARLVRETGLAGVRRRRGTRTTRADWSQRAAPDRVERHLQAETSNRLRVADRPTYRPERDWCTGRSCSTSSASVSWDGRWAIIMNTYPTGRSIS